MQESLLMSPTLEESIESVEFLGEVPTSGFINGTELASAIGLTAGTAQHTNEPWLHFELDGKTLYVAKKPYRRSVTWNQINAVGAVFGSCRVVIDGLEYKVRLLKTAVGDTYAGSIGLYDPEGAWGSEWNRLFYPLVPNPTRKPVGGLSGEGILYGSLGNYTEVDLVVHTSAGSGSLCWCQETASTSPTYRILRGYQGVSYLIWDLASRVSSHYGWRPVLELVE